MIKSEQDEQINNTEEHSEGINIAYMKNDMESQNRLTVLFFKAVDKELGDLCDDVFQKFSVTERWVQFQNIKNYIHNNPNAIQKISTVIRNIKTGIVGISCLEGFFLGTDVSKKMLTYG